MLIRVLLPTLFLSAAIYFLHVRAMELSFYWIYWWFDIFIHTLTGFVVGLLTAFLVYRLRRGISRKKALIISLAGVLVIALAWEVFEYVNGFAHPPQGYEIDTTIDIVVGLIGGALAWFYVSSIHE